MQAQVVPEARIKAILAMTPQQMAETGKWTKSAYDKMLVHINGIKDKATRDLVLDMVLRPESKVFKAQATQSYLASPAAATALKNRDITHPVVRLVLQHAH